MGQVTLNSIVNRYFVRKKEVDQSNYDYYVALAIAAAKKLNVYASNSFEVEVLEVNTDTNTAKVPESMVDWVLVAGCINGKMYTLDYRRDLCTHQNEKVCDASGNLLSEQDVLSAISSNNDTGLNYDSCFSFNGVMHGDECVENLFAVGAGFPSLGMFKFNENKTRIHLKNISSGITEILLVYKSSGVKKGANVFIDEMMEEPIVAYVRKEKALDFDEPNIAAKEQAWRQAFNQVKYNKHSITIQQLIKSARRYTGVGVLPR